MMSAPAPPAVRRHDRGRLNFPPPSSAGYNVGVSIILSAFGVAFAAFCILLAVRIVNRREKWAKWTAAAMLVLGYPLSWGPLLWVDFRGLIPKALHPLTEAVYSPMDWLLMKGPWPVHDLLSWYVRLWIEIKV